MNVIICFFPAYRKCQPDDFHCGTSAAAAGGSGAPGADTCVPRDKRCDGYVDCRSGRDEEGCPGVACRLDQFRCEGGQRCVDATQKCDHKNDCGDNSDETGCRKWTIYLHKLNSWNHRNTFRGDLMMTSVAELLAA